MYVVLTVRTSEQSLGVSLGRHLNDILFEGDFSKKADSFFRSAVTKRTLGPLAGTDGDDTPEAAAERRAKLESELKAAAAELVQKVNAESLQKHVDKRMEQLRKEQNEGAARASVQKLPHES